MTRGRLIQLAVLGILTAFFVTHRLFYLTATCLWFDEIFSVHAASQPWLSLLSFVALDLIHPPLFYLLLKFWIALGGESLWWIRALPFVLSLAAIIPLYGLVKELKLHFNIFAITYCFYIVSGSILKYSLELRMYSLLLLLALISMWLFVRSLNSGKGFTALLAVNILLVYSHYFGWFIVASEIGVVLAFDRSKLRHIIVSAGITILAFMPWAVTVLRAAPAGQGLEQNIGWMSRPGPRQVGVLILNLIEPFYYQLSSAQAASIYLISIPLILIFVAALALQVRRWNHIDGETIRSVVLLSAFILLPLVSAFAMSWLSPYSIWGTRHLIIVFIPCFIVAAIALSTVPTRGFRLLAMTAIPVLFFAAFVLESGRSATKYAWCEVGPLTANLSDPHLPVVVVEDLMAYHVWFALRGEISRPPVIRLAKVVGIMEDKAYFLPRGFTEVEKVDLVDLELTKFRLVYRARTLSESEPPLSDFIAKGYEILESNVVTVDSESVGVYLLERE